MREATKPGIGIDGCPAGWLLAALCSGLEPIGWEVSESLSYLLRSWPHSTYLVDMPVGLPDAKTTARECDALARARLGKKSSSIFTPPTRAAIHCHTYSQAKDVNYNETGKKISKQAWNLRSKMLQADACAEHPAFHESHPELAFQMLAGSALSTNKKTKEGQIERSTVLRSYMPLVDSFCEDILQHTRRSAVKMDDILDALVLSVTAALISDRPEGMIGLPAVPPVDGSGRKMQMVFWQAQS